MSLPLRSQTHQGIETPAKGVAATPFLHQPSSQGHVWGCNLSLETFLELSRSENWPYLIQPFVTQ